MTTGSGSRLTRRALFSVLGSGVAVVTGAVLWRRRAPDAEAAPPRARTVVPYADHDGWMVTPAEKQRLTAAAAPVAR